MAYRDEYSRNGGGQIQSAGSGAPAADDELRGAPLSSEGAPAQARRNDAEAKEALPGAEPPAQVSAQATAKPKKSGLKKAVGFLVLAAALAGGGYEGYGWWTNGRFMVSTDDAYVQADITVLSAKVSG